MELFNTPIQSPIFIALTIAYFFCASITTFDTRIIQAIKGGFLDPNSVKIPKWIGIFVILQWLIFIGLVTLNYKYAIIIFVIKFILKVLPILENVGAILLIPIVGRQTTSMVNIIAKTQREAKQKVDQIFEKHKN